MEQNRLQLTPGPNHPITLTPTPHRVVIKAGDTVIADTTHAIILREGSMAPVLYIPRADTRMDQLARNTLTTWCPFKGEAKYYDIAALGGAGTAAIWTYETPFPAVAEIDHHLAFYPDRVTIEQHG